MKDKLYKLMNWPKIEEVIYSEEDHPHDILGPHIYGNAVLFQMFRPGAKKAVLKNLDDKKEYKMEMADEAGFFAVLLPGKAIPAYVYEVEYADKKKEEFHDSYAFEPIIKKEDTDKFKAGIHYSVYTILGAHPMKVNKINGVHFAVWAPNARRVSVVGDFNHWDGRVHQMRKLWDSGIFELFIPEAKIGDNYKFELKVKGAFTYLKADPYAFSQQLRPETASVVSDIKKFKWEDKEWITQRKNSSLEDKPFSVYELYLGSFQKPDDGREYFNYRELAPMIISYVKEMGYSHIELMPIMEHPLDLSWGYQVIGYYAPTARYGTPADFMYFMNEMHKAGIGVILDWVPAHFPRDTVGLSAFDGTCLYEHQDPRQGSHPHWGTLIFNYGRPQVSNYLIANALFWIEQYHVDGIRMDAVASMLYLDYGKSHGEWVANIYGGNENLEALEFVKHLNSIIKKRANGAITIAEESTSWSKVTGDLEDGGLGFDFKWNMGWMNDYLEYIKFDPYFRSYHHNELTFSMLYAYSERFMLVLSHDEVVHGKSSLLSKMPGLYEEKFANLRITLSYMMFHPGKKLLFMGQDIGEFDEWNETRGLEWSLLQYASHKGIQTLMKKLNDLYRTYPALYELDSSKDGFEWISCINKNDCTISFLRKSKLPEETLLVVANFANAEKADYLVGVPFQGKYREVFNSNGKEFGGTGGANPKIKNSKELEFDGRKQAISLKLSPLSISLLTYTPFTEEELLANKAKKSTAVNDKKKASTGVKPTLKEELKKKVALADEAIESGSEATGKTEQHLQKKTVEKTQSTKAQSTKTQNAKTQNAKTQSTKAQKPKIQKKSEV